MSEINKSRNLFLEKEELVRWDKFNREDGYLDFAKRSIKNSGIVVRSSGNFLFTQGSDFTKIKLSADAIAYNANGERLIYKNQVDYEWTVPINAGTTRDSWVYMQYTTTHIENGTVTLSTDGAVTGSETEFTKLFRGHTTLVPNKMRIYERTTLIGTGSGYSYSLKGTYQINEVVDDTNIFVNAITALPAGTYVYSVVGAFSPGSFDDSREEEIYSYDSVEMVFSGAGATSATIGAQYLLCKVTTDDSSGTQTIVDLRENFFSLVPNYSPVTGRYSFTNFDYIRNNSKGTTSVTLSSGTTYDPLALSSRDQYTNVVILNPTLDVSIGRLNFSNAVEYGENIKIFNRGLFNIVFKPSAYAQGFNIDADLTLQSRKWVELQFCPSNSDGNQWTIFKQE